MPCRDYWPDANQEYHDKREKQQRDKLARIACNALTALEMARPGGLGVQNALVDAGVSVKQIEEALTWWDQHKKDDAAEQARRDRKAELKKKGQAILAKLTPSQREALREVGVDIKETPAKKVATKKLNPKKKLVAVKKAK
jgi:hypothetical protein